MTYAEVARAAAWQESMALRAYARAGRPVPKCRPVDRWGEWERHKHGVGERRQGDVAA